MSIMPFMANDVKKFYTLSSTIIKNYSYNFCTVSKSGVVSDDPKFC